MSQTDKTSEAVSANGYAGLFLVSLSTLAYEILLTRIFSVTMWYHFAFMAVSVAMFGMTVGAVSVYLFPKVFSPSRTGFHLGLASLLFSLSMFGALLAQILMPFLTHQIVNLVILSYLVTSLPFIFSGICISLVLTRFPGQLSKLYAVDLAGAACGCILLIYLLKISDGPASIVCLSAFVGLGSLLFTRGTKGWLKWAAILNAAAFLLFAGYNIFAVKNEHPLLRLAWAKGRFQPAPLYERWNSFSRVQVKRDRDENNPSGWGLSSEYHGNPSPVKEFQIDIDASASTVLTHYQGDLNQLEYLKYDATNFVHYLRQDGNVLVIGMGGGRDVLSALVFHQRSVTGVEINDQILEAVNGKFGDFTGHLDRDPRVTLVNDEARSYITRQNSLYHIIQVSLVDTWAATAAGAFALSENSIYTTEAWNIFLSHLQPHGILSVSRWYGEGQTPSLYRLASLARAAVESTGAAHPEQHIAIILSEPMQKGKRLKSVATMLVCKEPFSEQDLKVIESEAGKMNFDVLLSPRGSPDEDLAKIVTGVDLPDYRYDISPTTDDRPFFFNTFPASTFLTFWNRARPGANPGPDTVLCSLVVLVSVLTIAFVFLPLLLTLKRAGGKGVSSFLVFFGSIGVGFMMIEVSQAQRLAIFLGHPTYGLSVVLFSLLLSTGLGSYLTSKAPDANLRRSGVLLLLLLLATTFLFGMVTPHILKTFERSSVAVHLTVAAVILSPLGVCLGMAFPLGMRMASFKFSGLTPWFWGVNGATSVCASVFAVVVALIYGIPASFWTGFLFYIFAFLGFLKASAAAQSQFDTSTA
jgi:hypothetical protein